MANELEGEKCVVRATSEEVNETKKVRSESPMVTSFVNEEKVEARTNKVTSYGTPEKGDFWISDQQQRGDLLVHHEELDEERTAVIRHDLATDRVRGESGLRVESDGGRLEGVVRHDSRVEDGVVEGDAVGREGEQMDQVLIKRAVLIPRENWVQVLREKQVGIIRGAARSRSFCAPRS